MPDVVVLPSAEADLDAIATYTKQQWGRDQARQYLASLRAVMDDLGDFPQRHPRYDSAFGPFHRAPSGDHRIYYRLEGNTILVVRVLHSRMDPSDQL
ncbi:type II toxin-antitoxin system RelE/ParE family toxin [Qipengyuania sp.]|uniref:type II toxin-antitoxin system RelE/ParE family toxin n=1 Tax=Qipengyuania sp. TaxID=2004515 RepID=UPI003AF6DD69